MYELEPEGPYPNDTDGRRQLDTSLGLCSDHHSFCLRLWGEGENLGMGYGLCSIIAKSRGFSIFALRLQAHDLFEPVKCRFNTYLLFKINAYKGLSIKADIF